ncbi:hypothetical protein ASG67_17535 [Sphingomonas sp. Leaf339]|uniref:MarR family winged helix-turn-helix transcriptional regulator n=1 Tax=Sphingomonas sp. Leaf339 TaxID=1736343 RepID=UPI0006F6276C|nr:MarR family winged helix-turn-helix transcriptional regulator [Sphingomonas sp. Leaf339]KQU56922.1 hypothetical protein ASG67_17535 [Sphingomonas sp. Leaf339]
MYAERRRRDDAIGIAGELFGEPAWDMLLYLYVQGSENAATSTTALCDASCSPGTTALRWIAKLTEVGLIERHIDDADRRRHHVRLTVAGVQRVKEMLRAI